MGGTSSATLAMAHGSEEAGWKRSVANPQASQATSSRSAAVPPRAEDAPSQGGAVYSRLGELTAKEAAALCLGNYYFPILVVSAYCVSIPLTIFCAARYMAVPSMLWCILTIVLDLNFMIDKDRYKEFSTPCHRFVHDALQGLRSLCTTLLPLILAYFCGGSWYFIASQQAIASDCSVTELPRLAQEGYFGFECKDGFVAAKMQVGVRAWKTEKEIKIQSSTYHMYPHVMPGGGTFGGRRLSSSPLMVEDSDQNHYGFEAPLYVSEEAFDRNEAPVAWAVKAGLPVSWSECSSGNIQHKTCGIFAIHLWDAWKGVSVIPNFGASWGYNITHFHPSSMLHARHELQSHFPGHHLGSIEDPATFVIPEDVKEYLGPAYTQFWITVTLLALGCVDRSSKSLYHAVEKCVEEEPRLAVVAEEQTEHVVEKDAEVWDLCPGGASENKEQSQRIEVDAPPAAAPLQSAQPQRDRSTSYAMNPFTVSARYADHKGVQYL